ncbi:MAG: hypothetical protein D6802_11815 [Ardenticatenia bacterium]|nr:MAG: hypothetical protein D6802_11815 [Ardenticatenia bacterium]
MSFNGGRVSYGISPFDACGEHSILTGMNKRWMLFFFIFILWPHTVYADGGGWLVATRRLDGQDDIWAQSADGGAWVRLTATPDDERDPVWSPDGTRLAYAARRAKNWDVYLLDLRDGSETRLTTDPHYDGEPAWSPDGTRLAFVSQRAGDLDIFLLDLRDGSLQNLTADSPAHEFSPAWSPDGRTLAFISTRNGTGDLFALDLATGDVAPLLVSDGEERHPHYLPDGRLVLQRTLGRETQVGVWTPETDTWQPLNLVNTALEPAVSPDGREVRWLEPRSEVATLMQARDVEGRTWPERRSPPMPETVRGLAWGTPDETLLRAYAQTVPPLAPPAPQPDDEPAEIVELPEFSLGIPYSTVRLSSKVAESFRRLRERVRQASGIDFLVDISDALRPLNLETDDSDYLSWHKAGRAVDTLWDIGWRGRYAWLEVVREDRNGEVFWRLWLRCRVQDGSCGEPLTEQPWDFSYAARWELYPGEGGAPRGFLDGYYVDFTTLARDEGWLRISSYEDADFDWRTDKNALEYWHYQRTDGLTWWAAMQELYTSEELQRWFDWPHLVERAIPLWYLRAKAIPVPPEMQQTTTWYVLNR